MTEYETRSPSLPGARPALIGAVLGLFGSATLLLFSSTQGGPPEPPTEAVSQAVIAVALLAPFVLSLTVVRTAAHIRAGVWLGAGVVSLALGVFSFAVTILVHLPAGILLLIGGGLAMRRARPAIAVALMAAVMVVGTGSFLARSITTDPQCWALVRTELGTEWRETEPHPGPALGSTLGPNAIQGWCTSDVMTFSEAGTVVVGWAMLGAVVAILARRAGPRNPRSPVSPMGAAA